ncbi:hypothetical protein EC973_007731 [Apophysomyces ossiformis]|uniref:Uncharacterized protein n=1 Tax=Apophysomyces ossiformis TaxID=679940 RepID=A0A8H7BYY8_9FUNG|nr:hypothetical protein EC973_007731 [Apophysomyces ossiformis]
MSTPASPYATLQSREKKKKNKAGNSRFLEESGPADYRRGAGVAINNLENPMQSSTTSMAIDNITYSEDENSSGGSLQRITGLANFLTWAFPNWPSKSKENDQPEPTSKNEAAAKSKGNSKDLNLTISKEITVTGAETVAATNLAADNSGKSIQILHRNMGSSEIPRSDRKRLMWPLNVPKTDTKNNKSSIGMKSMPLSATHKQNLSMGPTKESAGLQSSGSGNSETTKERDRIASVSQSMSGIRPKQSTSGKVVNGKDTTEKAAKKKLQAIEPERNLGVRIPNSAPAESLLSQDSTSVKFANQACVAASQDLSQKQTVRSKRKAIPKSQDVLEHDGSLRMWWYDMYEDRRKGAVYVFGKEG